MPLRFPKPRPAALERADRRAALVARDKAENVKVKARSGGRCEVVVAGRRCPRRAVHVHHLLGGWGVRARGNSAFARAKVHVCVGCHGDIHAHILVRDGAHWRAVR